MTLSILWGVSRGKSRGGSKAINEIGNIYGKLTVVLRSGSTDGQAHWECRCECGRTRFATGCKLRSPDGPRGCRRCGAMGKGPRSRGGGGQNFINEVGNVFGFLTVVQRSAVSQPRIRKGRADKGTPAAWLCQCQCGETRTVTGSNLRCGKTKACMSCVRKPKIRLQPAPIPAPLELPPIQWLSRESDYEPIPVNLPDVMRWAEGQGVEFKSWDDLPRVNMTREMMELPTFKRLFNKPKFTGGSHETAISF